MAYLLAAVGGALGALARWGVATALPSSSADWPVATLLVNLSGCLLLGVLLGTLEARSPAARWPRLLLGTGVLGGFTTYSTFAVDVVRLSDAGSAGTAAAYVVASVVGGVLAAGTGLWLGRRTGRPLRPARGPVAS
ncbi:fluoride efflux transporter CrcB [Blastococcus sp. TF02A-26]|uniref:fluoride efflux transporter CrcB n=1 Tax=Blastococcus sp. TF02A-26 TaxID=2250577 RepID=UPI000DE9DFCD|nr:fluoride efflux transporter CrcB [Blastococcus sp. TF02A-26]RBY88588.1 fluoride efflux transporter CrcB [Blastococcus sp. TF02A-26]